MTYPLHSLHVAHENTAVVMIDLQEKLAGTMKDDVWSITKRNARNLLASAKLFEMPVVVTEQYPKGLGPTVPELRGEFPDGAKPIDKLEFDCSAAPDFMADLRNTGRHQVILAGMEAHICVLQTALGLLRSGYKVWVAQDAVCSRAEENWRAAIRIMENAGVIVAPTETILFMILRRAGSPEFKELSKLIR